MFRIIFFSFSLFMAALYAEKASALGKIGQTSANYSVALNGIPVGRLDVAANVSKTQYSIVANLRSSGLASIFKKISFLIKSNGLLAGGDRYSPRNYSEESNVNNVNVFLTMKYRNNLPFPSKVFPAPALLAKNQFGTIDPMTAIFAVFRDRPKNELCKLDLILFDGKKRTAIKFIPKETSGSDVRCDGFYSRIGGFSDKKITEGTEFPLEIEYELIGGIYQVNWLVIKSPRGRASFSRR